MVYSKSSLILYDLLDCVLTLALHHPRTISIKLLKDWGMWGFLAVNFKCPMKPAFFHVKGIPVCHIWLLLQSPWRSAKQFSNQGGLHYHLYMALNLYIALLCVYNLYIYCERAGNINQLLCSSLVAFILDSSKNLNTEPFLISPMN